MIYQELGNDSGASFCIREIAATAAAKGDYARAARLLGASDKRRERAGRPLSPTEQEMRERTAQTIRPGLTEAAFHKYHEEGYAAQGIPEA